jgi:hypothetical protein
LFSSIVAVPMLGSYEAKIIESGSSSGRLAFRTLEVLAEPDDEYYMRRAIRLASNVPKYPFGALLVDHKGVVVAEGWNLYTFLKDLGLVGNRYPSCRAFTSEFFP